MEKQSLTYKTFRNISYGVVGYIWAFVFALFITPVIVLKLGAEMYGVYVLVLTVTSLMGLFDLGIGQILIKYISEYHTVGNEKRLKDLMYSFNSILLGLSITGLMMFFLIGYWADSLFPSSVVSSREYFIIFALSGLISFVSGLNSLFAMVPVALQRFDYSTKIGLASMTLSNLTILLLVLSGHKLKAIFLAQLLYSILFFIIQRHYARKILPLAELKFSWAWVEVKNAYKFGIATYMSNAANSALTYFDRLLIPIFLGPSALSYYSLPGNVAAKTPGVINTLSGVIFPIISGLHGLHDMEKIKNIYKRALNLLTVISFAITISIVLFANKILLYWLSAEFASKSTTVLIILAFTYYLLSLGGTLNSFLLGLSKTRFLFQASTVMALANIALLLLLLPKFGIIGAAWAYLISVFPIVYMFYYVEKKFFDLSGRVLDYLALYFKLAIASVPFVIICKLVFLPLTHSLKTLIFFGPASVISYLVIYRVFGFFNREDVAAINAYFNLIFNKFRIAK